MMFPLVIAFKFVFPYFTGQTMRLIISVLCLIWLVFSAMSFRKTMWEHGADDTIFEFIAALLPNLIYMFNL